MKIYVARHCSTEYSEKEVYCGSTDAPLSVRGRMEAEHLSVLAEKLHFRLVISSPLIRARETAIAIAGGRVPILYDDRLKERCFGDFEQTSCARPDGKICRYSFAVKYPHGESNLQVAARIYAFLDELKEKYAGEDVFLVSHGSACRIIRTYFMELSDEEFFAYSQPNGTIETYEMDVSR